MFRVSQSRSRGAMTLEASPLADGQVATTTGAVFTATAESIVKWATFHNTSTTLQTLNIYFTRSGQTRRQLYQVSLKARKTFFWDEPLSLSSGDVISADTTTASTVDYVIAGAVNA